MFYFRVNFAILAVLTGTDTWFCLSPSVTAAAPVSWGLAGGAHTTPQSQFKDLGQQENNPTKEN